MLDITPKKVIEENCKLYGISYEELTGKSRTDELVKIRSKIAVILRKNFDLSFPQIGELLNRDHTTIIHLLKIYNRNKSIRTRKIIRYRSKKCLFCREKFIPKNKNQKYCSSNCACLYQRNNYKNNYLRKLDYRLCKNCNKKFIPKTIEQCFCSKSCRSYSRRFLRKPLIKEYFFERANFQCEECGKSDTLLECHHKIPIYKGGKDNKENIIVLCVICHWKKHQDKSINMFTKIKAKSG